MAKLRLGSLSGLVPPSYRMKTVGPNGQAPSLVAMLRDFRPQQKLFLALGLMLVLMLSWWHFLSLDLPHMPDLSRSAHKAATDPASSLPGREAIQNATLGFEKIYALALPDRSDRIKPLLEGARATNLSITVLNAVYDKDIDRSSWPKNWKPETHQRGELGCVVSHVRTWNKMLQDGVESAIVLESDADWDVRIHDIMAPFPKAVASLIDFPFPNTPAALDFREDFDPVQFRLEAEAEEEEVMRNEEEQDADLVKQHGIEDDDEADDALLVTDPDALLHPVPKSTRRGRRLSKLYTPSNDSSTTAPYRTHTWDILWFGHCGSPMWGSGSSRIYSWRDPSTPDEDHEWSFDLGFSHEQHVPGSRAVYLFSRTTCSTGYAITRRGAKKLVQYFQDTNDNLDIELSRSCVDRNDMVCMGVWPQIFNAIGSQSNIDHSGDGVKAGDGEKAVKEDEYSLEETEEQGRSRSAGPSVQFSARKNSWGILRRNWTHEQLIPEWRTMFAPGPNNSWGLVRLNISEAFKPWAL